ncbi:NADH-quinone oxidoreductase subunit NuoE [Candidatus Aerophobetes bacterium]|uniref:NADH-quinone oxidoreductase subunit NuoE n=1 Tax=Aerophobetes bacterium TaxID=2030807 RepID=A0A523S2A9_UNCAE|nr:MAG: NADH-quinone oxidoreductase subunit NuoE [Candidatus Aerophobetes bacterium]
MSGKLSEAEDKFSKSEVDKILKKYKNEAGSLIAILQEVQEVYGYLPEEILIYISEGTRVPLSKIYGIVTFYAQFSLIPRGRNTIKICQGTACHVKGGKRVLAKLERVLGIKAGQTSSDLKFTLEIVRCLGTCFLAPAMMINYDYFGKLTPDKVDNILGQY